MELLLKYPFLPLYAITVIFAIWRYRKYFDTALKFFPIVLMYTLVNEILGVLTTEYRDINLFVNDLFTTYNWIIYNIYFIIFCCYFFHIYYVYFKKKNLKKILTIGIILYALVSSINPFFDSFVFEAQIASHITGAVVLIYSAVMYMVQFRQTTDRFLGTNLLSWISLGIIIFHLGYIPIALIRYMDTLHLTITPDWVGEALTILIFIEYGCFIVGFLRMNRMKTA